MNKKIMSVSNKKKNGRKSKNGSKSIKSRSGYSVVKPNKLENGNGRQGVPKDELQAEILAAETEHPRIQQLLEIAEKNGVISMEEIVTVFPEAEEDIGILDEALASLLESGVEIVEKKVADDGHNEESEDPLAAEKDQFNSEIKKIKRRQRLAKNTALDVDDTIGLYLKEVGKVPLLTKDEEVWLAKRMEKAVKAEASLESGRRISTQRKMKLQYDIDDGMAAREHLVTANSRLVISVAKKYIGRGVPFLDLIQEGNIGLLRAAKKFDYHRGHKFSTYATWWIRQGITRAIADQGRTIRIPVHMIETINKLIRTSREVVQDVGREPTPEEIASQMDISVDKVRQVLAVAQEPISLETPIGDEEDSYLGDFIEDKKTKSPVAETDIILLRERVEDLLETLTDREKKVIELRFGIGDGCPRTLEEVGTEFDVTRERIRQIEAKALRKLRHPIRSQHLRGFIE